MSGEQSVICPDCNGSGKKGIFSKCKKCDGTGKILMKMEYDNLNFVFTLSPPIAYPSKEIRHEKFGKPICGFVEMARMNFSAVLVQYYKDQNNKMDRIVVCCFEPDDPTAKMIDTMEKMNRPLNEFFILFWVKMYQFFKSFGTVVIADQIYVPQEKTTVEWTTNQIRRKNHPAPKYGWSINKTTYINLIEETTQGLSGIPQKQYDEFIEQIRGDTKLHQCFLDLTHQIEDLVGDMAGIEKLRQKYPDHEMYQDIFDPREFTMRGQALNYALLGDFEKSIEWANKGLAINPKSPFLLYLKGKTLGDMRKYQEGIVYLMKAIELKPTFAEVYSELSVAQFKLGNYELAEQASIKAHELNPSIKVWHKPTEK
jgi:hypothetical protein